MSAAAAPVPARGGRSGTSALACVASLALGAARAEAEPLRLRADAFAQTPDSAGFVMLEAEARERRPVLVDAEALVWTGVGLDPRSQAKPLGEAVIASVRVRDPVRGLEGRFGRLVYYGGAVRPMHFDGAVATVRSPTGAVLDVFGGIPVLTSFQGRSFDWVVGGRTAQAIGKVASVGFSYFQQREAGRIARSEIGLEGAAYPTKSLALTSTAAIDTFRMGLAEARVSALVHDRQDRLEVFGVRRNPSLMLAATSLFAALGSYDSDSLGATGSWRAAPRLDLSATASVDFVSKRAGASQSIRAELRLDDQGSGAIGVDARRVSMPLTSWTGGRAWLRVPIVTRLSAATELEVAVPDRPDGRGAAWPWWLVGLRYLPTSWLETAAAVETSSTPLYARSFGALVRVSGTWGKP
jgi:hypothetical protein